MKILFSGGGFPFGKSRSGFTMIEIIAVIAILGIMYAVAMKFV